MIVFAFMAMVLLTNCSTTEEGVSVARVYNTECSHALRGAALTDSEDGDAGEMPQMEVKLTREGDIISGEIVNYHFFTGISSSDFFDSPADDNLFVSKLFCTFVREMCKSAYIRRL